MRLMLRNYVNSLLFVFILLGLSACSTIPSTQTKNAQGIEKFSLKGRASISGDLVENPGQGRVSWKQDGEISDISLYGPLGQGEIHIEYIPGSSAKVIINNKEEYYAETPDLLLKNILGQDWPITGLKNWVLGLPSYPSRSQVTREFSSNQIVNIQEDGWHIEYLEWRKYKGYELPRRMNLTRGATKIKLFIESWAL